MERQGRCTNYTKCLTGYRCATIGIGEGADFVCPECGQPLTPLAPEPKEAPKWIKPAIGTVAVLLLLTAVFFGFKTLYPMVREKLSAIGPVPPGEPAVQPATQQAPVAPPAVEAQTPRPRPAGESAAVSQTEQPSARPTLAPAPSATPPSASVAQDGNDNAQVKREVLKRIDLMPNVAPANKDKLYVNVERAREMRKIATIAFDIGKTTPASKDVDRLRLELQAPRVQRLLEDPTIVFVILGFADLTGDPKSNIRVSQSRGQSVLEAMRDRCGIANVMHVIAMGGSNLLDKEGVEKNRAVEVWAVLP